MQHIEEDYIKLYKEYHSSNKNLYEGDSYEAHHDTIKNLVINTDSKSLLDYGCGKAIQYTHKKLHNAWGFMPSLYDPGVEKFSVKPDDNFDGIYSTDVLEHIPKEVIPSVLEYIFNHANKFVFLAICTRPAGTILSNGENAHCTVEMIDWWVEQILKHDPKVLVHIKTYGYCNNEKIINPK